MLNVAGSATRLSARASAICVDTGYAIGVEAEQEQVSVENVELSKSRARVFTTYFMSDAQDMVLLQNHSKPKEAT